MLNRHITASGRSIPRMVVALALVGVGAAWLLSRVRPARMPPLREQARAARPAVSPEVPNPAEPLWASVAGEEDPGAAVEPPSAATPHDRRE